MTASYKQYQRVGFTDTIVFIPSALFKELIQLSRKNCVDAGIFIYRDQFQVSFYSYTVATSLNDDINKDIDKIYGEAIVYSEKGLNGSELSSDKMWNNYNLIIDDFKTEYPNLEDGVFFYFSHKDNATKKCYVIEFLEKITDAKLF